MTQRFLFASGDVGGARALIPVIRAALQTDARVGVLRHGHMAKEGDPCWSWVIPEDADDITPDVVFFASSVKDPMALALARRAKAKGAKTIHVLDSWTMYAARMTTDGEPRFDPDAHAVMDAAGVEGAVADGIPREIVHITGQPALGGFAERHDLARRPQHQNSIQVLFVSEPVTADHGTARGYTETDAINLFCGALQSSQRALAIHVLPHPREDVVRLSSIWDTAKGHLDVTQLPQNSLGRRLGHFDGIAGIASILLYEAWLMGRPVVSVQPGLRIDGLRHIGRRPGATLIDSLDNAQENIGAWISALTPGMPVKLRPEAALHEQAAERVLALASALLKKAS